MIAGFITQDVLDKVSVFINDKFQKFPKKEETEKLMEPMYGLSFCFLINELSEPVHFYIDRKNLVVSYREMASVNVLKVECTLQSFISFFYSQDQRRWIENHFKVEGDIRFFIRMYRLALAFDINWLDLVSQMLGKEYSSILVGFLDNIKTKVFAEEKERTQNLENLKYEDFQIDAQVYTNAHQNIKKLDLPYIKLSTTYFDLYKKVCERTQNIRLNNLLYN